MSGTVLYAFTLGLAGALNPCGFPLLPAYLAASAAEASLDAWPVRAVRAVGSGLLVTTGFIVVFAPLGVAVNAGVRLAFGWVPWVMVPVGVAMVVLGLTSLAGRSLRLIPLRRAPLSGRRRPLALAGFGIGYAVASLSCALPLFVAGVASSFSLGNGLAYALGMGLVIVAVGLAGASARPARLARLRALGPAIQRGAGAMVAVVGAYLVLYWTADFVSPTSQPAPVRAVEHVQATLSGWLTSSPRVTGVVLGAVALVALAAGALHGLRSQRPHAGVAGEQQ
jgi:cytochrome c-type biogenesis protein